MLTKIGMSIVKEARTIDWSNYQGGTVPHAGSLKRAKNIGRKAGRLASPAAFGLTYGYGLASGDMSVGEVAGDATAWFGAERAMDGAKKWLSNNPGGKISKAIGSLPKWTHSVGKFVAPALRFAIPISAAIAGGIVGDKIAPWRRGPQTAKQYLSSNASHS